MFSAPFIDVIRSHSGYINDNIIEHFGAPSVELTSLETDSVICPISNLIRIKATGRDRAKFLHNFCTNDINGLPVGSACEAIFTDVKARTLAHAYILAGESSHEIWMLPGDQQTILNHLNRYIITEDVVIEAVDFDFTTFVLAGPTTDAVLTASDCVQMAHLSENACGLSKGISTLKVIWNNLPTMFVSVPVDAAATIWKQLLEAGATAAGNFVFEHLRIQEGFPVCGQDLTSENMAPESGRNTKTISYTKGCYLGQEPIARLDAMGHVNKQLFLCNAAEVDSPEDFESLLIAASISPLETQSWPALAMLKVKTVNEGNQILARTKDGRCVSLTVVTPDK